MGCSAAKNLAVEPIHENGAAVEVADSRKTSVTKSASDGPALESEEPQTETLEATMNNVQETTNGLSFEIGFEGDSAESIIRKHPPKRFQRLEEQQTSPNLSLARLQEKLDEADVRRQQILQQRVASAKVRNALKRQNNVNNSEEGEGEGEEGKDVEEETEEDPDHLKVPPDIP